MKHPHTVKSGVHGDRAYYFKDKMYPSVKSTGVVFET